MSLGECRLHALKMVDLDVVSEIALVQHGHRKNIEKISRHIDKGGTYKLFRRCLVDTERGHHVRDGPPPHLGDDEVVEVTEHPAECQQNGTRRVAGNAAHQHQRAIEQDHTSSFYCASPSTSS